MYNFAEFNNFMFFYTFSIFKMNLRFREGLFDTGENKYESIDLEIKISAKLYDTTKLIPSCNFIIITF